MSEIRFNRWSHQSGTGGIYQDSSGNIGIGTSTPTSVLDIQGGSIKIGNDLLTSSGVSTFTSGLNVTGGSVGINETNPDRLLHVTVSSDTALVKFENSASSGRTQVQYVNPHGDWVHGIEGGSTSGDFLTYTGDSKNIKFYTSGAIRQKIQGDGKIIVGGNANQTANRNLSVVAASGNSNNTEIGLQPTNSSGGYNPEVIIGTTADGTYGAHMFFTTRDTSGNRTERLRITSTGNVGIGTDNPDGKLAVTGNGYNQINIANNNTANTNKLGGVTSQNYVGDKWSIIQTYSPSGSNQIYYGSADGSYRGATSHYFYVNSSPTATTGHTEALRITSNGIEVGSYTNSGNTVLFKTSQNNTTRINFYDNNNTEGCYLKAEGITNGGIFRMGRRWDTDTDKISFNMVDGTIGVPNGGGLSFAATSDASGMTSELLDDYEEGTWTPSIQGIASLDAAYGHYMKVGNIVHVVFYVQISSTKTYSSGYSGTSPFDLNMPFQCNNLSGAYWGAHIGNIRYIDFSTGSPKQFSMNIGNDRQVLTGRWIKDNSNWSAATLGDLYGNFSFHGSVTYSVD